MPPKSPNLFVGIPCHGSVPALFMQSIIELLCWTEHPLTLRTVIGCSLISKARNILVAEFLATDCTHLLFLDSDQDFSPGQVARLVAHDVPIVGGYYARKRSGDPRWNVRTLPDAPPVNPETGLQELAGIGTGFLLVARSVFEAMIAAYGHFSRYTADESGREEYDFFPVGPHTFPDGSRLYLGEDYGFCQRARDLGIPVHGDPTILLGHLGTATFPLIETPLSHA